MVAITADIGLLRSQESDWDRLADHVPSRLYQALNPSNQVLHVLANVGIDPAGLADREADRADVSRNVSDRAFRVTDLGTSKLVTAPDALSGDTVSTVTIRPNDGVHRASDDLAPETLRRALAGNLASASGKAITVHCVTCWK
jgi:hypothetical protein